MQHKILYYCCASKQGRYYSSCSLTRVFLQLIINCLISPLNKDLRVKNILFLVLLLISSVVIAQKPEDLLERWANKQPVEKAYLHFDRESYIAGETAWFKAYLSSDYLPDTISTNLYVELLSPGLALISRSSCPVILAVANGQLDIPDSLRAGTYTLRAYTPYMVKQSPDFIFRKTVYIHGKKVSDEGTAPVPGTKLSFFPEGGNLVAGMENNIAFKAVDGNGLPVTVKGTVQNSKGEEVASISDYHDGMGVFLLNPVAGEKYTAVLGTAKFPLPDAVAKGIAVSLIPHPKGNFFEIHEQPGDIDFTVAYMIGQMQHHVVFRQEFKAASSSLQGVINTEHLRSGILQVTFFNRNGMPLAERLCFINNKEYLQPAQLVEDTLNTDVHAKNKFRIVLKDTVQGNLSVSITDAAYEPAFRENNILTGLLLTSDIKGYVHNPAYYFSSDDDSVKTAADLLMMTNGWRRFSWQELPKLVPAVIATPAYITLAGRATLRGTNRSFSDKSLLLMITGITNKRSRSTQMLQTDKEGNFRVDSMLFFDKNRLLFSDVRGKKSQYIDVTLNDSLNKPYLFPGFSAWPAERIMEASRARWQMDYDAILKENGQMLEGVTIKVQKKTPAEIIDEKYTTGMFSGDAVKFIDLVNSDEALTYQNIFDYLQFRVNGLQVSTDGVDYTITYRQSPSMSSMGNIPMVLYLDEIETDASVIATIPANQIALVKVYNSFAASTGNGAGGVLSIYTKKGEDYGKSGSYGNLVIYNGYTVSKQFYSPDYSVKKESDRPDNRITLEWRPSIFVNNVNARIPVSFYNNDRTKKFKVVVEGMTNAGKLICLETVAGSK